MPICFMPGRFPGTDKDEVRDKALGVAHSDSVWATASIENVPDPRTHPEWREPPGYLGEAVRRAKRIASLNRPDTSSKPVTGDW